MIGIGRGQWTMVAAALTLGGSVRVGLEDNFYLPDGAMARSNGDLIARARRLTEDCGRRPATVEEARALLGISWSARLPDERRRMTRHLMLKMSELAQRSGVSAGTIKHYLREGLLGSDDDVVRTSRNMAYYPEQFVDRVRLIKRLQEERFMPLRVIRDVMGSDPERAARVIELEDRILELAAELEKDPSAHASRAARRAPPTTCRATCSSAWSSWRC